MRRSPRGLAASRAQAAARRQRFPRALGEDMEAFGVAAACRLAGCSFRVLRGASNQAGDRMTSGWVIGPALQAVGQALSRLLP